MEPTSLALQEESVLSEPRVLLSYNYFDNQKHPPQISKTSPMGQFQTPWEPLHSGTIALYVQWRPRRRWAGRTLQKTEQRGCKSHLGGQCWPCGSGAQKLSQWRDCYSAVWAPCQGGCVLCHHPSLSHVLICTLQGTLACSLSAFFFFTSQPVVVIGYTGAGRMRRLLLTFSSGGLLAGVACTQQFWP